MSRPTPPARLEFRPLRDGEADEACALAAAVFDACLAPLYGTEGRTGFLQFARPEALLARHAKGAATWVAADGPHLVGMLHVRERHHVSLLFVEPSRQGSGIATALLGRALEGGALVEPATVNSSPNAAGFYARAGFTATGPEQTTNGIRFVPMRRGPAAAAPARVRPGWMAWLRRRSWPGSLARALASVRVSLCRQHHAPPALAMRRPWDMVGRVPPDRTPPESLPLEDNVGDVLSKAMRGLNLGDTALGARAGVDPEAVQAARRNRGDEATLLALAPHLGLCPAALLGLFRGTWHPRPPGFIDGFALFTTHYDGMGVNAFLVWDPRSRRAAAFDTGATCEPLLAAAAANGLKIGLILLTHTHRDHVADIRRLASETHASVWASELEPFAGGRTFAEGHVFELGDVSIRTLSTWGHSAGGTTYVVTGLAKRLAIVGDSLFAASMGGGMVSYADAHRNNTEKILRLPEATVLACGHGPLTTVGEEKRHNPFFAAQDASPAVFSP